MFITGWLSRKSYHKIGYHQMERGYHVVFVARVVFAFSLISLVDRLLYLVNILVSLMKYILVQCINGVDLIVRVEKNFGDMIFITMPGIHIT